MIIVSLLLTAFALFLQHDGSVVPNQQHVQTQPRAKKEQREPFPAVMVQQQDGSQQPLKMDKLAIDIRIVGNLAITTMDMRFYNGTNRILEGELQFPLGDGQTVSRFAMDVQGKLREGVVVEKAKARQTFESIVRKNIDPGLLELTKGNTFRSRVYPLPANGGKRIVVAYEQELQYTDDGLLYTLPMNFPQAIDSFSFHAEVVNRENAPDLSQSDFSAVEFRRWQKSFRADYAATNIVADKQFTLLVPGARETSIVVEDYKGSTYFSLNTLPQVAVEKKVLPHTLCLLWDASGSGAQRDIERELLLLDGYFRAIGSCSVELVPFSNTALPSQRYTITNGAWDKLEAALRALPFDGGTQLGALDLTAYHCDEFVLCTDGIANFGATEPTLATTPVVAINSAQAAEHSHLRYIAQKTGGQYINLVEQSDEEALQSITHQTLSFISAQYSEGGVEELYPSIPTPVHKAFAMAGKLRTPSAVLALNFGFGNRIVSTKEVVISREKHAASTGVTPRIWAQQKLAELDMRYEHNKERITALGKEYSIVTRNTSLLVLDRIEDYVQHNIAPPESEPELRNQYLALVQEEKQREELSERQHLDRVAALFAQRKAWWNTVFDTTAAPRRAKTKRELQRPRILGFADSANGDSARVTVRLSTLPPPPTDADEDAATEEIQVLSGGLAAEYGNAAASSFSASPSDGGLSTRGGTEAETRIDINGTFKSQQHADGVVEKSSQKATIELKTWDPQTPYMHALRKAANEGLYAVYQEQKRNYAQSPSFFLDAATYFVEREQPELALRILSNIAEMELENHQLLRILGHKLLHMHHTGLAVSVFRDVLAMREEEPQSYRDLGLALEADGQHQQAVDMLYSLATKQWDSRFPEVELIALNEMNHIIASAGTRVSTHAIDSRLVAAMPVDIRVVLSWDADNTDIDLWVTDPHGEKCFYSHRQTAIGGSMSYDLTGGYGPEEFLLRRAINGSYSIQANYYGDRQQRLAGPTTLTATLYTNYGKPNETRRDITLQLQNVRDVIDIGSFVFTTATPKKK